MPRRQLPLVAVVAAAALALAACGEQVPGGTVLGDERTTEAEVTQALGAARAETAADATDPLVLKVGEREFLTTMAIYRTYDSAKGGPHALVAPTAPVEVIGDGRRQVFTAGEVYWSPRTGAHIVRGQILKTYLDNGGAGGRLGWPVTDETTDGGMIFSDFEHGRIKLEDMAIQVIERAG